MLRKSIKEISVVLVLILGCSILLGRSTAFSEFSARVYLPLVLRQQAQSISGYRVNAPYSSGEISNTGTAIFWLGRVTDDDTYGDVRVGYNERELYVWVAVFDRYLWYDPSPSVGELTDWDAATLYLSLGGNSGGAPDASAYRFVAQLNWWEARANYQAAYRGSGAGWVATTTPFTATTGWRGNAPNDRVDDKGWTATFRIPFTSIGMTGAPSEGDVWDLALAIHDRDDAAGTSMSVETWPPALDPQRPASWGQLSFGVPDYSPPAATPRETVVIRHKLNGQTVRDAAVGGTVGNMCPGDANFIWNQWGNANFAGASQINIQNQTDVADWPCFAKYYVTFPLDAVPAGKAIISATLTLHQFGNAGGGEWGTPYASWIQVLTVGEDWNEATLTWNNAPLARENTGWSRVDPIDANSWPGWPGVPRTWNVGRAVAQAYQLGQPVRLVLYSADSAYHSGKYFVSSDTEDWNAAGRPTLRVLWGDP